MVALAVGVVPFAVAVPTAFAGVGFGVTPQFPANVTVGQTGIPATIQVTNTSTPGDDTSNIQITSLFLVPACGTTFGVAPNNNCPAAQADPGVFQLSSTGTGEAGTACAGQTFLITVVDATTGQVSFTPTTGAIVLGPVNPPAPPPTPLPITCRINFTFSVLRVPTHPQSPPVGNTVRTAQLGFATGFSVNDPTVTGLGAGSSVVTVAKGLPAISTTATQTATIGGPISDTATLSPPPLIGPTPTGTITFTLFGPNNATSAGTAIFTSVVPVTAFTTYPSGPFTVTAPGTYRWVASYSGDANYTPRATTCGDAGEISTVTQATPTIVTTASAPVTIGGSISDSAVLAGGAAPTGTIIFTAYGPNDGQCAGPVRFTSTVPVDHGNGTYVSTPPFTPLVPGSYNWIAVYSGDANNVGVTSPCGAQGETTTVNQATPTIVTTASPQITIGGAVSDSAVLAGGVAPTGNIVFTLFGPNNVNCAGTAIFTSQVTVNGNGTYPSGSFTPLTAGTYRWVAVYSGDTNNASVTSPCNTAGESVVVAPATPAIVTSASPTVPAGGAIHDTATLSGGVAPTGNIVFTLFGPNNATCSGTAIFTSQVTVNGNGSYPSAPFTTVLAGTYRWIATYSGDTNNAAVATLCADPAEAVVVTPAAPTISTQASAPVTLGGTISDTATLAGGSAPTGTITFTVFGPNNGTCSGTPAFPPTVVTVNGNGAYPSGTFTPTAAGTYRFVAVYSGDINNSPAGPTSCSDPAEAVVVSPGAPTIVTHVSGAVPVGGTITDTATLAGGVAPTGTITFNFFGPNNLNCSGTPAFVSTKTVTGNGNYTSDPFTTPAAGSYRVVAFYSGDTNNASAGPTACADPAEITTGNKVTPVIATTASATTRITGAIVDTAMLSNGFNPTGNITFNIYGPNPTTCTGLAAFTTNTTVNGNGNYNSAPFVPTAPGNYTFVATYNGDANNNPAGPTACNDPAETVQVLPAAVTLTTTASGGGSVTVSQTITDTAHLAGGTNPTGLITFRLYTAASGCTGVPITTSTRTVAGNGDYTSDPYVTTTAGTFVWTATYGGDVNNNAAGPTACNDPAETVQVLPLPMIAVTKAANPLTRPEPGGNFTFTVQVSNPSTVEAVKITSLFDNIYGDLATRPGSTCGTLIGVTLAPGATSLPCTFTGPFAGHGGDSQTDTVTVTGVDIHGVVVTATAQATVALTVVPPSISVTKVANPLSLPAPGGLFTFTVTVTNTNTVDPVKITSLVDNIYGDLATRPGSSCGLLIGTTLAPGATSPPCTFTGPFTGKSGDSQTDTVTVTGVDSHGTTVTATANATVILTPGALPQIAVTKAANPLSLPEPGGTFTFTVTVSNPSPTVPVKITSLVDNIYGNLATRAGSTCGALIGVTLAPGATTAPCTFPGPFTGVSGASQTDTVTVTGVDSNGNTVTATAQATVTLTPPILPQISVTKAANPPSLPAPGGTFTFTVQVHNPSAVDPVKITSLVDNIYGDLATRAGSTCGALIGTTLAPGASSVPCSFSGPFNGKAGDSQTDTVTVTGVDSNGHTVTATAQATVILVPAPTPVIVVSKVANPLSLPAPGGTFTFTVQVSNPSTLVPVKITSLVDNIYGNLATRAGSTCGALIGVTLAPGATSAPCSFTGAFTGVSGASQTDIVTVTGVDNNGNTVTATAQATVVLTPAALPQIKVTKAANPLSLPAPGGTFTFVVQVSNPSAVVPVKITSLVDNIYGDLSTRAGSTCGALIGTTLAPGASSVPCQFTGPFSGVSGASQTDTVTVTGVDTNGNTVTATAQATVILTPAPTPAILVTKAANPVSRPEPGGTFTFTVTVINPSTVVPIKITKLTDNIYGDLATRPGSTCGALIGTTLAPGATSAPCTFTGPFTGKNGDRQTDIVTVTGVDNNGTTVTATAQATVVLTPPPTPMLAVSKAASPLTLPAPGGNFTFTVSVNNPSKDDPIKITSLIDNVYGDLATLPGSTCGSLIGTTLAPGATSAPCTFVGQFKGNGGDAQTDTVTATGVDTNGNMAQSTAQATVHLTTTVTPSITVTKTANPLTLPAPGGNFTFTVTVTNTSSSDPVKITSVVDNVYGDLATRAGSTCGSLIGITLAPGATSPSCSFGGPFTGVGGSSQTDTVTVAGVDSHGVTVSNLARATVSITSVAPPPPSWPSPAMRAASATSWPPG